jgi:hypothetical protein
MNLHKWLLIWSCQGGFGMMRPISPAVEPMRFLSSFLGFALAIIISIFIFAPERLPVGYGFEPVPVDLVVENSLASQLVETVTGQNAKNLVITNTSDRPINNLTITLRDENRNIKHQYIANLVPAAEQITLGWAQKWSFASGDELEAVASTYTKVIWAL